MFKIENKKTVFEIQKKGKTVKTITLKNRLTDLYLDYVLYKMLPSSIGNTLFTEFASPSDLTATFMSYGYLEFTNTQTIDDDDTTMNYDYQSYTLFSSDMDGTIGENNKTLTTTYIFNLSGTANDLLYTGIGFGRDALVETDYLFSFIDLSSLGIYSNTDVGVLVTRYDEITSNATTTSGNYLPMDGTGINFGGTLQKIYICYGLNGTGTRYEYDINDLTLVRGTAGIIDITGFDNYYNGDGLFPSTTLYPATDLYPEEFGEFKSVVFEYDITGGATTTQQEVYVNKEDLDVSYNDTQVKIKLKCERGDY